MPNQIPTKILTIDDEEAVRRSLRSYLEDSDYDVIEACNGREGLELFRSESPDVILCDLRMPEVDGLQVLAAVTAESPETPILIVSGTGVIGDAIEAVRRGAWDYILKPIQDMATMEYAIEKALERARLLRENRLYQLHLEEEVRRRTSALEAQTQALNHANEELQNDIEQRIKTEIALRESEMLFRTVIERLDEGLVITDRDDHITFLNEQYANMCGYETKELMGTPVWLMCLEQQQPLMQERTQKRLQGQSEKYETQLVKKDGSLFWVEIFSGPYPNVNGEIIGTLSSVSDISVRKQAEQERENLESQLRRSQKLETIGTLAGGVAHDFNNILTPIFGYAEMAKFHMSKDSPARADIEQITQAAHRARDLVRQIMTFSRQGEQERKPVLIQLIVREAMKQLRSTLPPTIDIREDIASACDPVHCDPTQIHQILLNLCTNSYHAMQSHGGLLVVKLCTVEVDTEFSCLHVNLKEGKYVRITVADTGHGMDRATLERVFEPFFTTKEAGEGTGLGLSVVHGIVMAHGGGVTAYSEPGNGTTFQVYLPCTKDTCQLETEENLPILDGEERILFVDDERVNALMGKQILTRLGYSVMARTNSMEALELFRAEPDRFDLVITDQTMPGLTGAELAHEMHLIRPEIPILLISGFSETVSARNYKQMGFSGYLMKPMIMSELSTTIRQVLETSRNRVDIS